MERRHFINFDIAGFTYWDGTLAFQELIIGTKLQLRREEDNKFAPYAVAIYYKDYKLGFIPRDKNKEISKLCEQGYTGIFERELTGFRRTSIRKTKLESLYILKNVTITSREAPYCSTIKSHRI